MTTNHCAMRLWRWGIVNSKIQVLEGQCSLPRSLGRLGPKNSPKSSKSRRIWDCNKTLMQGECQHNWTILEGHAHYRLHRRLVFQLGKRAFQGSFPCLAGQPAPGQRKLPNSQLDSSLSRETALCKVASLGSKWFKVHTLPVLHDIHIAAGTITHLCRGQTLRPRLSGRWMTGRSRVVYVLLLKAPQNRNI